jgi:hypothetical protein
LGTQDLIGAVFVAAPSKYHTVLNITSDIKGKSLDIDELEKVMYNLWQQGGGKHSADNKDNALVLGAFVGTCCVCKEQGHNATDCPSKSSGGGGGHKSYGKPNSNKKKFMGTCNNCGKFGHKKSDCWALEASKNKRPNSYLGTTEQCMTTVVTSKEEEVEYVLGGIKDEIDTDELEFVDTEVSLYSMHLGDMYDNLIMPEDLPEDKVGDEDIVMATIKFPGNMKMLSNPNIYRLAYILHLLIWE